jgi:hypothetical protein
MRNFQENPDLTSEFENLFRLSHKWKNGARGVKIRPLPNMMI